MELSKRLLANIAWMYYEKNMTQQRIAEATGINRMKVSRLLQKAKEQGVVRVMIDYTGTNIEIENELARAYGLKEAIVVDEAGTANSKERVAAAAAFYLENNLENGQVVAVGWGSTMCEVAEYIGEIPEKNLLFTPAIGGHGKSELDFHATSIASNLAKRTGCRYLPLLAPAFAATKAERDTFVGDPHIREVLDVSAKADLVLFSLGNPLSEGSTLSKAGYFSPEDLAGLHAENAICDLISILFLNRRGEICCENLTEKSVGLIPEELKAIPRKVCAVSGPEKREPALVALRAGYIDVLIADLGIASYLAEKTEEKL